MNLGSYTTTEAIRGCLGVDENDCPDAVMVDSLLDVELEVNLDGWLPAHTTLFAAGTANGALPEAVKIAKVMRLYAQWWCAKEIASRELLMPQMASDGKTRMDRFKVDLAKVAANAASKTGSYMNELLDLTGGTPSAAGEMTLMVVSIPDNDPITDVIQ